MALVISISYREFKGQLLLLVVLMENCVLTKWLSKGGVSSV